VKISHTWKYKYYTYVEVKKCKPDRIVITRDWEGCVVGGEGNCGKTVIGFDQRMLYTYIEITH
jgi:hypothetical protein